MLAVSSLFSSLLKITASHELVDSSGACRLSTSCCGHGNIECVNSNIFCDQYLVSQISL